VTDTLEAVIFDHSVLLRDDVETLVLLRKLLHRLKAQGLSIVVFSTHPLRIARALKTRRLPQADLLLTRNDIGKSKGSHEWVEEAARRLGIERHQFLYVGDGELDWRTAINAAIFYLHAGWAGPLPPGTQALVAPRPPLVWIFATHFLLRPPRWEFTLDVPDRGIHLRSLLNASAELAATDPYSEFSLQDVLTYGVSVQVRSIPAQNLLMLHALSSLLLEGAIPRNPVIAVYPSSTPGRISPVLRSFLEPAAKLFHGYFKDDLLVRSKPAPDTSRLRAQDRGNEVLFQTQTNTVHVNGDHRNLVEGKTILIFDDFTTSGKSLDWARNLLYEAGAARVVGLTIGKYGYKPITEIYEPREISIAPYALGKYEDSNFRKLLYDMRHNPSAYEVVRTSFSRYTEGKPLPP
jgi:phosphoribosylpyrophosphate synthetase